MEDIAQAIFMISKKGFTLQELNLLLVKLGYDDHGDLKKITSSKPLDISLR